MKRVVLILSIVVFSLLPFVAMARANIAAPSSANFDIELQHWPGSGNTVEIIEPTAGSPVYVKQGDSFTVKFESPAGTYNIEVNGTNVGSGPAVVGTNTATATLPSPFAEGFYDLKVTVDGDSDTESDAVVMDNTPPVVTLTSPDGGEVLFGCTEHDITWTPATDLNLAAKPISLYYSTNNGQSWKRIRRSETNDGRYSWTVPCESSDESLVKVEAVDLAGNVGFDISSDVFTILCAEDVVFQSDRASDWEIYKMSDRGYYQESLTDNEADDTSPAWSPDGKEIVFASNRDGNWEVYKMHANGLYQENLSENPADDASPAWSPDGEEIVFQSNRDGNWEVYKMRASGLHQENLTENPANDTSPAWSPDGEDIVFASNRDGNWEVYKMSASGLHQENLTENPADDTSPAWSPDGEDIVFASNRDGNWEVYKMDDRGYDKENLTENPADDTSPAWWPYCDRIFFQSNRDGNWEVYKMHTNGLYQENLSENPAADMIDSWAAPPTASFTSNSPQCLCTVIQFTDTTTGGSPPYTYNWDFGDGIDTSTLQNPSYHYADAGTYNVTLVVTDTNGLLDTATGQVTVYPKPVADAGPDKEISKGDSVAIGGSPTASGGTPPYTYAWMPTTGLDDPTKANPIASPFTTTTYTVEVTDANGCMDTDDVVVTVTYKIFLPLILKSYPAGV